MNELEPSPQAPSPSPLSRRRVLSSAAWTVPAVTLASAAPAFADSLSVNPAIRAGSTTLGLLDRDVIGIHTKRVGTVLGLPVYGSSPELRITATNTGDVPLTNVRHTVYLLADIGVSLGTPPDSPEPGWEFVGKRNLVAADVDIIQSADFGLAVNLGIGVAYEFIYAGPLAPGASATLNFPLSPYDDSVTIVTTLTNLLSGLTGMSYTQGMYDGSYQYGGSTIGDPALLNPQLLPRTS